ncbi:MAG: recombination mediator RecR [Patescibacteria group bacterium]
MYPFPITKLIKAFSRLPGVGTRTAERFVFHLLRSGKKETGELILALRDLTERIKSCTTCWDFSDVSPCAICQNKKRDPAILCVVALPHDIQVIESTGSFSGRYHVLRGLLSEDSEANPAFKIKELLGRIKEGSFKEILLALNPNLAGEQTMMYLEQSIAKVNPSLTVTRLARGLPLGSDIAYADEITLKSAIAHRTKK